MKNLKLYTFLMILLGIMLIPVQTATAQEALEAEAPRRVDLPIGIGFQSMIPAFGISGMYDITPKVTGQAVLGFFGGVQTYAGRVLYHFSQHNSYNLFGFGGVGAWRYAGVSAVGLGGGGGIELNWARLFDAPTFPPIFSNLEIGFFYFNEELASVSALSIGGGIHYRF